MAKFAFWAFSEVRSFPGALRCFVPQRTYIPLTQEYAASVTWGSGTSRDQKQPTEGCTPCGGDHDATVRDNASRLTAATEPSDRLLARSVGGGSGVRGARSKQGSSCRRRQPTDAVCILL